MWHRFAFCALSACLACWLGAMRANAGPKTWDPNGGIDVSVYAPTDVAFGETIDILVNATDLDHWSRVSPPPLEGQSFDGFTYQWSVGEGSINGASTSDGVNWTAPADGEPRDIIITVLVDDFGGDAQDPDSGTREDGTVSVTITIHVGVCQE